MRPVKGIAMSGFGMDRDVQKSLQAGFSEHVVKPVLLEQLEAIIQRAAPPDTRSSPAAAA